MGATFSECGRYRYTLSRDWLGRGGLCVFVMLNPSTAGGYTDDPTVRKCIGFSKRWGYSGLRVLNLFAWRETSPERLTLPDRYEVAGPDNFNHWHRILNKANVGRVVAAWGSHASLYGQDRTGREWLRAAGAKPVCFGLTKTGQPQHPLYIPYGRQVIPFRL